LKLGELSNPQILKEEELKKVTGGNICYTGMTCGRGVCWSTPAGSNCMCVDEVDGYYPSYLCGS
jgi:hypothetical protein